MAKMEALVKHLKDNGASLAVISDLAELVGMVRTLSEQVHAVAAGIACQEVILEHHNLFNDEIAKEIRPKVRKKLGLPEVEAAEETPPAQS